MDQWDPAAKERLQDIVGQLRAVRVVDVLESTIACVWCTNVARYEPSDLGDTARSLGVTAAENIRELALRERWSRTGKSILGQDVHVTAPNDSLLIASGGVSLRAMKAPSMVTLAEPNWGDFVWTNESDVRKAAARNNRARYNPFHIGSGTLFDGDNLPVEGDPRALCDAVLVWAGGSSGPYTGGWIGLPTLSAESPWLAVQRVWWHQADEHGARRDRPRPTDPDLDTFERRPLPQPEIRLKPKPKTAEQ
jgi:hypothetical protein